MKSRDATGRILVAGVEDGWSSARLVESFRDCGCDTLLVDMEDLSLDLPSDRLLWKGKRLEAIRAVVVKKVGGRYSPALLSRLDLLEHLQLRHEVPVFSEPAAMRLALDRLSCTLTLQRAGIPMPGTRITEDIALAERTVEEFGTAVLKPLYTSKARGMRLLRPGQDLRRDLRRYRESGNLVFYLQRFVQHPGRDLGIVFLGGEYLGAYARIPGGSWNTTIHEGGRYAPVDPAPEVIDLARRAQQAFGLAFTGVDVVESEEGPLVYEVSAFGGFRGLMDSSGIDAARAYAEWVLEWLS